MHKVKSQTSSFLPCPRAWAAAAVIFAVSAPGMAAEGPSAGKFHWNNKNTHDQARVIGNDEALGGIRFSPGLPSAATNSVPLGRDHGFDPDLSVGALALPGAPPLSALRLPESDDGMYTRHGVELSWSGDRVLPNLSGDDLLVAESGNSSSGPDAFMVRVRSTRSGEWSFWYFFSPQAEYLGNASRRGSAIFLTPVDLNVFGLSFGESVDRIQIANMTTSDRLDVRGIPVAKKGVVVTGREGENLARPDPNFKALAQFEEGNKFGPDILYVASLQYIANR